MIAIPKEAPYGTWISPVDAEALTSAVVIFESVLVDDVTGEVYHIERRPSEAGRSVLVQSRDRKDVVGSMWNVRTAVHEYGGGAATVSGGVAYFSHYKDNGVYRVTDGVDPEPVTPENENWRYSNFIVFRENLDILISIMEDHTRPEPVNVVNKLVAINTVTRTIDTLAEGADFYSSPTVSKDGSRLCWIQWYHPDMPWDGSELVAADIVAQSNSIRTKNPVVIAGRKSEVSVCQPQWAPDGTLFFLNDVSGFTNPWICSFSAGTHSCTPLVTQPIQEEFSGPAWQFGDSDYAILDANTVLFASIRDGRSVFTLADLRSCALTPITASYSLVSYLRALSPQKAVFLARKDDEADAVIQVELPLGGSAPTYAAIVSAPEQPYPRDLISVMQPYALSVPPDNAPVHVLFYPPHNPTYTAPAGELPPTVFSIHGGPTGRTRPGLDWTKQYWTTRGWALVEVDYGGSSGYGRKYRERLRGEWGIVDVNDTVEAVKQLSKRGLVDGKRAAIRGGSAGGFTVLSCLVIAPKVFAAGTSLYGISDLVKLVEDMHKFESRYCEVLLGGTPKEIPDVYRERSPISHADKFEAPLLIFQGSIDTVVLPSQAELIVASIKRRGGRVNYILFEGEGHGWRKAENIKLALEAELAWYESVFGIVKPHVAAL